MLDLALLMLLSVVLVKYSTALGLILALIAGFLVAVIFGGSFSLVKAVPALVLSLATPFFYALMTDFALIPKAVLTGAALFGGYLVGSIVNLFFFPVKFVLKLLKGLLRFS